MGESEKFVEKWKAEDGDELRKYKAKYFTEVITEGQEIKEFDIDLYFKMIVKMTVYKEEKIITRFLDGTEVECIIG